MEETVLLDEMRVRMSFCWVEDVGDIGSNKDIKQYRKSMDRLNFSFYFPNFPACSCRTLQWIRLSKGFFAITMLVFAK